MGKGEISKRPVNNEFKNHLSLFNIKKSIFDPSAVMILSWSKAF